TRYRRTGIQRLACPKWTAAGDVTQAGFSALRLCRRPDRPLGRRGRGYDHRLRIQLDAPTLLVPRAALHPTRHTGPRGRPGSDAPPVGARVAQERTTPAVNNGG